MTRKYTQAMLAEMVAMVMIEVESVLADPTMKFGDANGTYGMVHRLNKAIAGEDVDLDDIWELTGHSGDGPMMLGTKSTQY